jgi:ABC-type nickel/cobalt efflux system permease component RcnA
MPALAWLSAEGVLPALGVALLLGLRHASDPDHIAAVATLAVAGERRGPRAAAALGLAWGLGHGVTLLVLGLPVVLADVQLPEAIQRLAELGVGVVIVFLGARLVLRWRRGELHAHPHPHGERWHAHPHFHAHAGHAHAGQLGHSHRGHEHAHARSPLAAFGIGLVHGVGGSAAAGVLVLATMESRAAAALALAVFAGGTAVTMACASGALGLALAAGPLAQRLERLAPALGLAGVVFGAWYAYGALVPAPVH